MPNKPKRTGREVAIRRSPVNHRPPQTGVYNVQRNPMGSVIAYTIILVLVIVLFGVGGIWLGNYISRPDPVVVASPTLTPTITPTVKPEKWAVSQKGRKFITAIEGIAYVPYLDAANLCTAGIGHRVPKYYCVNDDTIAIARIYKWFDQDIANVEDFLNVEIDGVELNQCQFDALASFTFNVGPYVFRYSGIPIHLRMGQYEEIPYDLERRIYSVGGDLPNMGLITRREAEARVWDECYYGIQDDI